MYVFWVKEFNVNNLHCVFFKQQTDEKYQRLGNAKQVLEDNTGTVDNENTSWPAFHASRQPPDA